MNFYRIAQAKYRRAIKISRCLRFIPGVKMIAVCNSLSYNRAQPESDIDLFIIASPGRIWTVRFFSLLLLKVLNLRPGSPARLNQEKVFNERQNQDKICLSFIITADNLDLSKYKICIQDNYLAYWIKQLRPLYNENNVYQRFVQANNWIFRKPMINPLIRSRQTLTAIAIHNLTGFYRPNYRRRLAESKYLKFLFNALVTNWDELIYKRIQLKVMPIYIKQTASDWDSRVILSDKVLKFHLNDARLKWQNQCFDD